MDDGRDALARRIEALERSLRRRRLAALAAIAAAATFCFLERPRAMVAQQNLPRETDVRPFNPPPAGEPRDHIVVVEERLKMARHALELIANVGLLGNPVNNQVGDIYTWSKRLLGSQIYLSMSEGEPRVEDPEVYLALPHVEPKRDRVAAFEAHWRRMREWEERIRGLAAAGRVSRLMFMEIQAHRLQAELWLARERLKAAKSDAKPKGKGE
ncbi:MAG TPA: hypothetical protein VG406_07550 [Isosphaeraceae bacterium]|jgi:hypothetical protein|nr:hypothetical protein [Isosphaeraceae bacterium]